MPRLASFIVVAYYVTIVVCYPLPAVPRADGIFLVHSQATSLAEAGNSPSVIIFDAIQARTFVFALLSPVSAIRLSHFTETLHTCTLLTGTSARR